jgi:hypothetical protein
MRLEDSSKTKNQNAKISSGKVQSLSTYKSADVKVKGQNYATSYIKGIIRCEFISPK